MGRVGLMFIVEGRRTVCVVIYLFHIFCTNGSVQNCQSGLKCKFTSRAVQKYGFYNSRLFKIVPTCMSLWEINYESIFFFVMEKFRTDFAGNLLNSWLKSILGHEACAWGLKSLKIKHDWFVYHFWLLYTQ